MNSWHQPFAWKKSALCWVLFFSSLVCCYVFVGKEGEEASLHLLQSINILASSELRRSYSCPALYYLVFGCNGGKGSPFSLRKRYQCMAFVSDTCVALYWCDVPAMKVYSNMCCSLRVTYTLYGLKTNFGTIETMWNRKWPIQCMYVHGARLILDLLLSFSSNSSCQVKSAHGLYNRVCTQMLCLLVCIIVQRQKHIHLMYMM